MIFGTPSIELTIAKNVQLFVQNAQMTYEGIVRAFITMSTLIWANPDGLTPQQVLDGFGTNAGSLFALAGDMSAYITQAEIKLGIPPTQRFTFIVPYAYTINADGTVLVGDPIAAA